RPSGSSCQYRVGTVYGSARLSVSLIWIGSAVMVRTPAPRYAPVDPRRYRQRMDWNLRHCSRKGHVTYAPTEAELRDRLHGPTPAGEAWRCLRCGDYVIGAPRGEGPAERAPQVLRGRALRDAVIL